MQASLFTQTRPAFAIGFLTYALCFTNNLQSDLAMKAANLAKDDQQNSANRINPCFAQLEGVRARIAKCVISKTELRPESLHGNRCVCLFALEVEQLNYRNSILVAPLPSNLTASQSTFQLAKCTTLSQYSILITLSNYTAHYSHSVALQTTDMDLSRCCHYKCISIAFYARWKFQYKILIDVLINIGCFNTDS